MTPQLTPHPDRPTIPFDSTKIQGLKAKQAKRLDTSTTITATVTLWLVPLLLLGGVMVRDAVITGMSTRLLWRTSYRSLASPLLLALYVLTLPAIGWAVHTFRHRHDVTLVELPDFPPEPDLRHSDDLLLGAAYTWDGAAPGEKVPSDTECLPDPHLVIPASGQFANIHVIGATGSGKTESMIKPLLTQIITKHPKPEPPRRILEERASRDPAAAAWLASEDAKDAMQVKFAQDFSWLRSRPGFRWAFGDSNLHQTLVQQCAASLAARTTATSIIGRGVHRLAAALGAYAADEPYAGLVEADALMARYETLKRGWEAKKCGLFMLDPKGDLADFVLRVATLAGRADDVVILRPGSKWTYNPLLLNERPLTMAEFVMDGVKAVAEGEAGPNYWRQVMSEWLTNGLHILKSVAPHKLTFEELLAMARDEQLRTRYVGQAIQIRMEQDQEEARLASLGLPYTGPTVDEGAVRFFKDFDSEDSDPKKRREVISGLKAYFKFFVESDIRTSA